METVTSAEQGQLGWCQRTVWKMQLTYDGVSMPLWVLGSPVRDEEDAVACPAGELLRTPDEEEAFAGELLPPGRARPPHFLRPTP